jgi:hypothetical protein
MARKPPPPAVMLNLTIGHWVSRLIHVAATLRLADLLKDGSKTADQLAAAVGVQAPALYRVLRALASIGVFAETGGGRFKITLRWQRPFRQASPRHCMAGSNGQRALSTGPPGSSSFTA